MCAKHFKRWQRHGDPTAGDDRERPTSCAVEGCPNEPESRGWCHGHYLRWLRNGDVQPDVPLQRKKQPERCTVDGCGREAHAKGVCQSHRYRQRVHGDPRPDLPVKQLAGEGWISHGYRCVPVPPELRHLTNGETQIGERRLVMAIHLGRPLHADEVVHHINGIRTDNRIENLELWSTSPPKGQRVVDKVKHAIELLRRHCPHVLAEEHRGPRLLTVSGM